ncbi:MAG: hypothetical protein COU06_01225 [Candidatus Harrisonbacteria bacterium CG10_big_fil_rev_8_21_14_0_10_38_8]|uniref:R3H domain-containing protein n=1 Tax=Candidatus Harrisonbacteria bacterium CG10_big_fil_rev_8_21_14_0_10_38_8 TaxID=1974582 RepID=A0A2M6WKA6_9BACT|nr:MAG: hypothetical protein COU06_01225 [Candidatus Harrisonbacteria bacterium CG10_big_fil_rev_8_21_14_0_10_38_8]
MEQKLPEKIKKLVELLGLKDLVIEFNEEERRVSICADEEEWFNKQVPQLVKDFKHIISLMARKTQEEPFFVDINNYRKERERLIIELAKAAAQKVATSKEEVRLPAMNSYERRIVHAELSMRPDIKTESDGEGRQRCVVIKLI